MLRILLFVGAALAAEPVVKVLNGSYCGLHLPQFKQDLFLGMPYAKDTGGQNRFRIPQSLDTTWEGARHAWNYSNACPDNDPIDDGIYGMSEDCLSINVVRPSAISSDTKYPVMLWIHGGSGVLSDLILQNYSYQVGTSGLPFYNLTYLVDRSVKVGKPIIGASINYRKGGWGNMYSTEVQGSGNTNLALRDMRKALAWIQENIAAFGGDNNSVTIWGESSGSFAVGQLLMTYGGRTDGLFHRSIQESGSSSTAWCNSSSWYQPIYDKIVEQVNCTYAIDTLECLRTIPYETIYPFLNSSAINGPGWYPTVDGDIYPNFPTILLEQGRFAHIPHLYGSNSDEGTDNAPVGLINTDADLRNYLLYDTGFGFPNSTVTEIMNLYPDDPALSVPINTGNHRFEKEGYQYKRVAAIVGDVFYHATRLNDARHYSKYSPTYIYRFNTRPYEPDTATHLPPTYKGVEHFSEVSFIFGNPTYVGPWPEHMALSEQMSAQWISFAHSGDPNGDGLPHWPLYNQSEKGLNLVLQTERQGGNYVEEDTYRLAGREYLTKWARRRNV